MLPMLWKMCVQKSTFAKSCEIQNENIVNVINNIITSPGNVLH